MTLLRLLPTLLVAAAAIIAPLFAGIPGDEVWTNLCLALGFGAVGVQCLSNPKRNSPSSITRLEKTMIAGFGVLVASTIISAIANLFGKEPGQYSDVMLRSIGYWLGLCAIAAAASGIAKSRTTRYAIILSVVFAATIASAIGVQDYLVTTFRNHIPNWREFGTSTPDYFAAYLLLTIPLTLSLFLGAPTGAGKRASWLYALALVLQLAVLPTTGSRFALISVIVSLIVFAALVLLGRKSGGLALAPEFRKRTLILAGVCVVGGLVFAAPLIHRLQAGTMTDQAHSGEFRIWTWRGAIKLAEQRILLGTGPGMFIYAYPKVAMVSFTRVAHSGYLQLLDEFGIVGLAGISVGLISLIALGLQAIRKNSPREEVATDNSLSVFAVSNDRLIACGITAGIVGGLLQNFIDSDWYVTLFAVTLAAAVGLLYGISTQSKVDVEMSTRAYSKVFGTATAAFCVVACAACLLWTAAAGAAKTGNFAKAVSLDPLDASYHSDYAWKQLIPQAQYSSAESELDRAIALGPDSVFYYRRSELYDQSNRPQLALADIRTGLALNPNSLELLERGGEVSEELGDRAGAMMFYKKIADLGAGIYGNIRPITEIVEYRYALADAALGIDAAKADDPSAMDYLTRAETILEAYCDEGGSANAMRAAEVGGSGPQLDQKLQTVYGNVMTAIVTTDRREGKTADAAAAQAKASSYFPRFLHETTTANGAAGSGG